MRQDRSAQEAAAIVVDGFGHFISPQREEIESTISFVVTMALA